MIYRIFAGFDIKVSDCITGHKSRNAKEQTGHA
jgi:hypothetical protein